ncbi:hypothetical protein, partial [Pseudoalteromonas sp. MMG007]|uniref:hypothetical protein n=1 Tax=Pseudoalteromonas sp. MMG007 TaxID=2822684 RepID=UPI001B376399
VPADNPALYGEESFEHLGGQEHTNYPFDLSIDDFGKDFEFELQVTQGVGGARILEYLEVVVASLLDALQSQSSQPVLRLSLLPLVEREQLLCHWEDCVDDVTQG